MNRFYEKAEWVAGEQGYDILLDRRPVRTPARALLTVPTAGFAAAIAAEWQAQGKTIDPRSMPLTGLANAAIDQVAANLPLFVRQAAAYAESDTLCYRADPGDPLAERQDREWEPLLDWAERRYDCAFLRVAGIIHRPQPVEMLARMHDEVSRLDCFVLAGLGVLASLGGSLVAALALIEKAFDPEAVWRAILLEELWQEEQWGSDSEAIEKRTSRRAEFDAALNFCHLAAGS
ncbi:MAG: ATP12 family protein [Blastomonas sp.]